MLTLQILLRLRTSVISSFPTAPLIPQSLCFNRCSISATKFCLLCFTETFSLKIQHTVHSRGDPMPVLCALTPFTFRPLGGVWKLASSEVQFANDVLDFFQTSFKTSRSMFCQKHRLKIASLRIGKHRIVKTLHR